MAFSLAIATFAGTSAVSFATSNATEITAEEAKRVEITVAELPQTILDDLKATHPGVEVKKAYKLVEETSDKVVGYEVHLKTTGEDVTVSYDANGKRSSK